MHTRISVRVIPNASRTEVAGPYGAGWKVKVQTPPEGGRANKAVAECLASALAVPKRSVMLESGEKSRDKVFKVENIDEGFVFNRLSLLSTTA